MDDMRKKWMGKVLSVGLLSVVLVGGHVPAQAAGDNIRVALFVDTGQGYRGVVPSITLTAENGMDVVLNGPEGKTDLPELKGDAARYRVDEYHLIVAETGDWNRAQQIAQQMSQRKYEGSIQVANRNGQTVYQVVSGTYDTYQAAANQAKTVAQAIGQNPLVKGPHRLEAGTFKSLKEAQEWQASFEAAGIPAYPVMVSDGDKVKYAVWIGDEVSPDAVKELKRRANAAFPSFSYQEPDSQSYVILKQDVYGSPDEVIWKYVFSPQVKLTVEANKAGDESVIGVVEREQRTYRGEMELSEYNGHLTLVNELPMEEYLYGVVGSEMAPGWPLEALKTQAVLSRTRAVWQGNKYGVANVSDTVFEQAYYGYTKESDDVREAVDETEGEIIYYQGKPAESLFYSNAGGMTADGTEVWGNPVPYLRSVESKDTYPMDNASVWYKVALADGTLGYVRNDLVTETGQSNSAGQRIAVISTENTNLRSGPSTTTQRVLSVLPTGAEVTILSEVKEENAYSWTRGPFTSTEIAAMINAAHDKNKAPRISGNVTSLKVTERGPSGRVIAMEANGMPIVVSSPDALRSVFQQGGSPLRSTKFEVEKINGSQFIFRGTGFGHGLGVSQYGARAMAEEGYDYKDILQHYYQDVTIEK
ncbi:MULTISPECIES: SpoIID/LytB domain-containing protein [Brevibacillus]|uniref:SpoIID/LytB domain-containing protein n=1 Tax=Brevibacillus TaxID=55080 RepID=UPI001C8D757D|nr:MULTISPECIES: SpoIID/LytB domain-containing protein [Brevibacillus]MBY0088129.1 SpoIID/LytB domain-containing protein [Brevibacillus brevis]MCE0451811.1 SpoIID/LytB domain-containing protein [Brevibacillus sp. AF8]